MDLPLVYQGFSEQRRYRIGQYIIGGLPGENPVWLVGSIFYLGDKLLLSEKGEFDRLGASEKIEEASNIAEEYGVVFGLDVVFPSSESVDKILPFVAEYDIPLFLDSPDPLVRAKSYRLAREIGVNDRSIANGVFIDSPYEEIEALRDSGIKTTVVMLFDPRKPAETLYPENRIKLLDKLLELARKAGIENIIVDAIVIDPASIAFSAETVYLVKKNYGYPSGCAPANALGPASKKSIGIENMYGVHGGIAAYLRLHGADYIMYGPLSRIKYIAPVVSIIDSLLGYSLRRKGISISGVHPLKKLFREIQKLFATSR
ncbi:MAG: tetrahydromethanopterin S-methyltransferase subunit H [Thermoprotei archaeon]